LGEHVGGVDRTRQQDTDRVVWALRRFTPELLGRICGTPKGFCASPTEQQALERVIEGLFPIGARTRGAILDTLVSEPEVDTSRWNGSACPP
jgi:hypothetical protein